VGLSELLKNLNIAFHYTQKEIRTKTDDQVNNFFIGFYRTLFRSPEKDEKAFFSAADALSRGATQAKVMFMKILFGKEYSKYQNYLPDECFYSKARLEHIHYFLSEMIVNDDMISLRKVKDNIIRLILKSTKAKGKASDWKLLENYKVPSGKVFEGLYTMKEKVKKGKKKLIPVKPKAPSKRIEVLFAEERQYLEYHELPFADFKKLAISLKDGCPLADVESKVSEAIRLTKERWDVVKKFSAPLTYRSKVLVRLAKDKKIKGQLTKSSVNALVNAISQGEIELNFEDLVELSSYHIVEAAQKGLSNTSRAFKDILQRKNFKKAVELIDKDSNPQTIYSILDENLSILMPKDPPNYRKHLEVPKEPQDDDDNKDIVVDDVDDNV
jgi:hypothetical protein